MNSGRTDNQVRFRASSEMLAFLAERDGGDGISAVARKGLERYFDLMGEIVPFFPENEALLLCEAIGDDGPSVHAARLLWAEVDDEIERNGLDVKYGVDRATLVNRLRRTFSRAELVAIVDACECAWTLFIRTDSIPLEKAVRQVGLVEAK